MHNRLSNHFDGNSFLSEEQFGFKANHSTSMALLRPINQILSEIDKGIISIEVFIDSSKVPDTIDHIIISDEL